MRKLIHYLIFIFIVVLYSMLLIIEYQSSMVYAAGSQERDAYALVFKNKTKSYGFPLRNIRTYRPIDIDTTNDVVYFKVKKNVEDVTYVITKLCTFEKKFIHSGVTGTIADGSTVTGTTSGATGTIAYLDEAGEEVYISSVTGTFEEGEVVYKTADTHYFTIEDDGVWLGVTSLSTSDTNLNIGDYFAYVELKNTSEGYDEVLLKSKWKVIQ